MSAEEKTNAEKRDRLIPMSRTNGTNDGLYAIPIYIRDCSNERVVTPWRRFFLLWEGHPPHRSFEDEHNVSIAAQDAARSIARYLRMQSYASIFPPGARNVYRVDHRFWNEFVVRQQVCFARYANGRMIVPKDVPTVEDVGPDADVEELFQKDREYVASLMRAEQKVNAEERCRFLPISRSRSVEDIYAMPVYMRDCSNERVVAPWRWFFLIWEGYPPYGALDHERAVRAAAEDAVRVVGAHYGMNAYTFILKTADLNVYLVDDHFWEEMVVKRRLCFARYADGRVLIPGRLPIVEKPGADLEWYLEEEREHIAALAQEEREAQVAAPAAQSLK